MNVQEFLKVWIKGKFKDLSPDSERRFSEESLMDLMEAYAAQKIPSVDNNDCNKPDYISGFHSEDGLFFKRESDGAVTITKYEGTIKVFEQTLADNYWASVIASVSAEGEENLRWYKAMEWHNGESLQAKQEPQMPSEREIIEKLIQFVAEAGGEVDFNQAKYWGYTYLESLSKQNH